MKKLPCNRLFSTLSPCSVALFCAVLPASAQSAVVLGAADSFAVLGGSAVTDAGGSLFFGDVGVSPGTAIGINSAQVSGGSVHSNDALAQQAHTDAEAAYGVIAGLATGTNLTGQDLGGMTLTPGIYTFTSSAALTGILTLDGQNMSDPEFIFRIGTSLTTATVASVLTTNGADSSDIFFQVGSSATLGTGTNFQGTILADQSITTVTGTTVTGRLLAINAKVDLGTNTVVAIPEPSSLLLLSLSAITLTGRRRRTTR